MECSLLRARLSKGVGGKELSARAKGGTEREKRKGKNDGVFFLRAKLAPLREAPAAACRKGVGGKECRRRRARSWGGRAEVAKKNPGIFSRAPPREATPAPRLRRAPATRGEGERRNRRRRRRRRRSGRERAEGGLLMRSEATTAQEYLIFTLP